MVMVVPTQIARQSRAGLVLAHLLSVVLFVVTRSLLAMKPAMMEMMFQMMDAQQQLARLKQGTRATLVQIQ